MLTMVRLHQDVCVEVLDRLPRVVTVWVPLPFDEILESTHLTEEVVIDDGLDLILRVFIHEVWGRSGVVWPMCRSLSEQSQQQGVEDVMDPPGWGEIELECDGRDDLFDVEWTLSSRRKLV